MSNKGYIYCLLDPRNENPRYIGQTSVSIESRVYDHLRCRERTKKSNWIKSLLKKGLSPIIEVLDTPDVSELNFWEMHYISLYKSWGFDLTNLTNGGDGIRGFKWLRPVSHDLRLKRSELMIKRKPILLKRMKELGSFKKISEKNKLNGVYAKKSIDMKVKNPMMDRDTVLKAIRTRIENYENRILQYSKHGEFIKEWKSVAACSKELNILESNIFSVLNGKTVTAGGFHWIRKGDSINQNVLIRKKKKRSVSILQYDLDGNFIKEWASISDASCFFVNKNKSSINDALSGNAKSAFGYIWKNKTDNFPLKIDKITEPNLVKRKVCQYDLNGNFIKEYKSVKDAQFAMNGKYTGGVTQVLQGKQNKSYGYLWK